MERPELALHMGNHFVSDFVKEQPASREPYPLDLYFDHSLEAVRLHNLAPANTMWGQYWYRSGINNSMRAELQRIVTEITERVKLEKDDGLRICSRDHPEHLPSPKPLSTITWYNTSGYWNCQ
jgi:hypothetical protein